MAKKISKRARITGKGESGAFIMLRKDVLASANYLRLSPHAVKLFLDLYGQYNGFNNGDFCAAWKLMRPRGWRSKATLHKSLRELLWYEVIVLTRQGGKNLCSLYGVTFNQIDECKGKLNIRPGPALGTWRTPKEAFDLDPACKHGPGWTRSKLPAPSSGATSPTA